MPKGTEVEDQHLQTLLVDIGGFEEKFVRRFQEKLQRSVETPILDYYESRWLANIAELEKCYLIGGILSLDHIIELKKHIYVVIRYTDPDLEVHKQALAKLGRYEAMEKEYQTEDSQYTPQTLQRKMIETWSQLDHAVKRGIHGNANATQVFDMCSAIEVYAIFLQCATPELFRGLYARLDMIIQLIPGEKEHELGGSLERLRDLRDSYLQRSTTLQQDKA